ncbi:alpha/beta hydrolase [Solimonas soli]|uniref:alpha/beta hydrolase n=1 Tax=Solimonas soli TaxID=413479 RepID=UPI000A060CE6|nr:alpha/beta hydrolase [Solimonas soli]
MRAEPQERERAALPTTEVAVPALKAVSIGRRSRFITWLMRRLMRPYLSWLLRGSNERIARAQLLCASQVCRDSSGFAVDYDVIGAPDAGVPGHVVGRLTEREKTVVLWIHGGAFLLPAAPDIHVRLVARICRELDAVGFLPDYRLAPFNRFPAALDDCERAYQALLDLGFAPQRIVLAGESAGGNLVLGLLQRIRRRGWPMPACAVPISPVTEMGRVHAPPSRTLRMNSDPLLPIAGLQRVDELYAGSHDAHDPELSPLYADCRGFPPLYLLASDTEVLLDDSVLFARRARAAGVDLQLDVWPVLPHAFPLFGGLYPEVRQARDDIIAFARRHLG